MSLKAYVRVLVYYAIICAVLLASLAAILDSPPSQVSGGWTGLGVAVLGGVAAFGIEFCNDERRRRRERREWRKATVEQFDRLQRRKLR